MSINLDNPRAPRGYGLLRPLEQITRRPERLIWRWGRQVDAGSPGPSSLSLPRAPNGLVHVLYSPRRTAMMWWAVLFRP